MRSNYSFEAISLQLISYIIAPHAVLLLWEHMAGFIQPGLVKMGSSIKPGNLVSQGSVNFRKKQYG